MSATEAVEIPPVGTYRVDPAASSITFATRHMFGLGSVKGRLGLVSGEITISEPLTSSTASAAVDAGSFASGLAKRDSQIKSAKFLHVEEHPQITFRSTEAVPDGANWVLRGQVTARGNSAPLELTVVESRSDETGLHLRATGRVDRYAHGITKMKGMAGRHLDLDITARASRI